MKRPAKWWIGIVAALLVGAALGAGSTWFALQSRIDSMDEKTARLLAELETQRTRTTEESPTPPSLSTTETNAPSPKEPANVNVKPKGAERQFSLITSLSVPENQLVADYGQFLTGEEAAKAAAEAGGESPPPNDYYIVNENPKLRTLRLSPDARVILTTGEEGSVSEGFSSSVEQLASQMKTHPEWSSYRWYWLTIKNDSVILIEEQYIP